MAATAQIGTTGEHYVCWWLTQHGYSPNVIVDDSHATYVEARGNTRSLLVQVKSALQPEKPGSLAADEARELTSRAAQVGFEPWEARVQLDPQLRLVGQVEWRKLL